MILIILITGIIAGYFGAYYRSRGDVRLVQSQVDTHFNLVLRQHEMQLEAARQADLRKRLSDAYGQLGGWLHDLERSIDEVWFGCSSKDDATRLRTRHLLDSWPWETLRLPVEMRSAEFYWSSAVRGEIRQFEGLSVSFVNKARQAISEEHVSDDRNGSDEFGSAVWGSRLELRAALDRIRDQVRLDLGLEGRG
ncbi:hypothetical protein [Amycolatopsis arida]|uniref:hypothetical protein n=1 Tax=Amycolatopsis arida TaxID=587909 RepID=UPI0010657E85|nr:hypothetical protein [Amycolatopsis arida]